MTYLWMSALTLRIICKQLFKFRLEVFVGTLLYGCGLIAWRMALSTYGLSRSIHLKPPKLPQKPAKPTSVLQFNSLYRLSGLEVILGFDSGGNPIRIDLDRYHTLIGGVTGTGKTQAINSILIQLFGRNSVFTEAYDVYLLDLKSDPKDYLSKWASLTKAYYSIADSDGTAAAAIEALDEISRTMYTRNDDGKRKLVIIDEVAMLTQNAMNSNIRRKGEAALERLATQLRGKGALLVAIQRPHYKIIPRAVTTNTERKICLRVDDDSSAELVLRFRPQHNARTMRDGEFILYEPGRRFFKERTGRTMLVKTPEEIDVIIDKFIQVSSEEDVRLKLFREACQGLVTGAALPGINKVATGFAGLTNEEIKNYYRNYALSGAIEPKMRSNGTVGGYVLAKEYDAAFGDLISYIKDGHWREAPEPITE